MNNRRARNSSRQPFRPVMSHKAAEGPLLLPGDSADTFPISRQCAGHEIITLLLQGICRAPRWRGCVGRDDGVPGTTVLPCLGSASLALQNIQKTSGTVPADTESSPYIGSI
jgi:hypothetical protein